jgi:hypothetical protein
MGLIKKSDQKNHLSLRYRSKIYLCEPVSQPDATGYSVAEPGVIKVEPSAFVKDYSAEHTIAGRQATPTANPTGVMDPHPHVLSKSAQA